MKTVFPLCFGLGVRHGQRISGTVPQGSRRSDRFFEIGKNAAGDHVGAQCIRISGKEDGETVPIFALTADASATEVKKAYKYRFSALFSRPIDFVSLFDRISKEIAR